MPERLPSRRRRSRWLYRSTETLHRNRPQPAADVQAESPGTESRQRVKTLLDSRRVVPE